MFRKVLFLPVIALLGGCATGYQSGGLTGGYYQVSGLGRLEKIVFSGNGYIDPKTVQQYALYRCAEVAKERKKSYFLMYETLVAASTGRTAQLPAVGSVGNKPTAFAFVLFLDTPRPNAIETEKTLRELGEVVKKNNPQT